MVIDRVLVGCRAASALLMPLALLATPSIALADTPIATPLGQVFSAPLKVVKGLPTLDAVAATELAGLPRLNFLEVTPNSAGYQLSGVFQSTVAPPAGAAFTFFVTVRPSVGPPFRVARLPDGSGAAQRSTDGGITWTTFAPATAALSGQNVSVTVGRDAGLSPSDDVSVGWESVKPDNTGSYVESGPFALGSLAAQAPAKTLLMPRLGTAFVRSLPSGFQTCTMPPGASPTSAVVTPGSGITLHFAAPLSPGTLTLGDAPNFENTLTFNYLTGNTAGTTFTAFPGQFGSPASGTVKATRVGNDLTFPFAALPPALFPTTPGAALVLRASAKVGTTDCDAISAMVPFGVLAGQHVAAVPSAGKGVAAVSKPATKSSSGLLIGLGLALAAAAAAATLLLARTRSKRPAGPHTCTRAQAEVDAAEAEVKAVRARGDSYYRAKGDLSLAGAILENIPDEQSEWDRDTEYDIARRAAAADERLARARKALRRCLDGGPDLTSSFNPNPGTFDGAPPATDSEDDDPEERTEIT